MRQPCPFPDPLKMVFAAIMTLVVLISGCRKVSKAEPTTPTPPSNQSIDLNVSDQQVLVKAYWENMGGWGMGQLQSLPSVWNELNPLKPASAERTYGLADFQLFLPGNAVKVGEVWPLPGETIDVFLSQFHPEVRAEMNFDGSGAFAILSAVSPTKWEILFRLHAQFEFPESTFISPAQFNGRLVVNRLTGKVEDFQVLVPSYYIKNVAFEVRQGANLSGLGHVERMELAKADSGASENTVWTEQIPPATALELLGKQFFSCNQINWVLPSQALEKSKQTGKPIFAIVIEGVLTDQSC